MRKHHNKLYYGKYRFKNIFTMPWTGILYPTTDQKLLDIIRGKDKTLKYGNKSWQVSNQPNITRLSQFILDHRTKMKFRLQQDYAIFYSDKELAQELFETFWDSWHGSENVDPKFNKLNENTVGCRRLPHGKYQYQVHLKKDVHQRITKQERENLWSFLERNVDNCLVTNKYVLDYFEGKYPYCYHGYFYVSEQKMLTPIYMLAQKAIDKVIKYVKVKNESNKKIKRT